METLEQPEKRTPFALIFGMGFVIVLLVAGGFVAVSHWVGGGAPAAQKPLPFGPEQQAYAVRIHFINPGMSRAGNFLNEVFTYVNGDISNDGVQSIRALEVTVEFHDPFNQVVLRETERLIPRSAAPLPAGERRAFQLAFEHVPPQWDQRYPAIRVTGLDLQ